MLTAAMQKHFSSSVVKPGSLVSITTVETSLTHSRRPHLRSGLARRRHLCSSLAAKFDRKRRSKVQHFTGRKRQKFSITNADCKAIVFAGCIDCEINLDANCTKVFLERCKNVILRICGNVRAAR